MTKDPPQSEELISLAEAAEYSGLTHKFLRELAGKGRLRANRVKPSRKRGAAGVGQYRQSRRSKNQTS